MAERSPYYSYCFIRKDLPVPVQIVQAGHAWSQVSIKSSSDIDHSNFVLISADDEAALVKIAREVEELSVVYHMFYEPDGDVGYTALATGPLTGEQRTFFQRFEIMRA